MSLNFSRRSLFRVLATALLAVLCLGMLTACEDPNKPTCKGNGTLTFMNVTTKVTQSTDDKTTFTVDITNGRDNDIEINNASFSIIVKDSSGNVTATYDYDTLSLSKGAWALAKGESVTGITVKPSTTTVTATSGSTVTLRFRPDSSYKEMYASWIYTIE